MSHELPDDGAALATLDPPVPVEALRDPRRRPGARPGLAGVPMPKPQRRTQAKSLKGWRLLHGLTQRQAAAILGLNQTAFAQFETVKSYPRPALAKRLAILTGLPMSVLLGVDL